MNTKLPSVSNTRRVVIPAEGAEDAIPGVVPTTKHPFPVAQRQEERMRTNISRELGRLGLDK